MYITSFEGFKLFLLQYFERNFILTDESKYLDKEPMTAIDVFSAVIRYFKDQLLGECYKQLPEMNIMEDDVRWVVTIPAIWNDSAKQFMREAAETVKTTFILSCTGIIGDHHSSIL